MFLDKQSFQHTMWFFASVERTTVNVKALKRDLIFPNIKHPKRPIDHNIIKKI